MNLRKRKISEVRNLFDKKKFKGIILLKGKTLQDVANLLNISLSTLYRKMNGDSDFYRNEIDIIVREFDIENPNEIFFASNIA